MQLILPVHPFGLPFSSFASLCFALLRFASLCFDLPIAAIGPGPVSQGFPRLPNGSKAVSGI